MDIAYLTKPPFIVAELCQLDFQEANTAAINPIRNMGGSNEGILYIINKNLPLKMNIKINFK